MGPVQRSLSKQCYRSFQLPRGAWFQAPGRKLMTCSYFAIVFRKQFDFLSDSFRIPSLQIKALEPRKGWAHQLSCTMLLAQQQDLLSVKSSRGSWEDGGQASLGMQDLSENGRDLCVSASLLRSHLHPRACNSNKGVWCSKNKFVKIVLLWPFYRQGCCSSVVCPGSHNK